MAMHNNHQFYSKPSAPCHLVTKAVKPLSRLRPSRTEHAKLTVLEQTTSSPEIAEQISKLREKGQVCEKKCLVEGGSASESNLSARKDDTRHEEPIRLEKILSPGDQNSETKFKNMRPVSPRIEDPKKCIGEYKDNGLRGVSKNERSVKYARKPGCSSPEYDTDNPVSRQIRDIHTDTRKSARRIRDSRARILEIQKKTALTDSDVKELGERSDLLLREMERFDKLTRNMQKLVSAEMISYMKKPKPEEQIQFQYLPGSTYGKFGSPVHHEMKMNHPTVLLSAGNHPPELIIADQPSKSKSEIDLTRKLSESYDMQEKLVADNADLEVKRYILYKELMTKDQNLETCRAQVKRLQGELKMMNKENSILQEKLSKNNPQGDATSLKHDKDTTRIEHSDSNCKQDTNHFDAATAKNLVEKLANYKSSKSEIEKQLTDLEEQVRHIRVEMSRKPEDFDKSSCRGGNAGGPNTCFSQPGGGPAAPPMSRACGVCPPCPAPCNPNAPPTPAEKEVGRLTIVLRQTEENFKTKVTECAMLRAELLKKREELEKEKCQHKEVQARLRELEMRFEGLTAHTNMMLGTKEQALENEVNVRALKQCYREAKDEIEELRLLLKEQNDQLQDYRVKYIQAQQLVEEQRRQMDMMDMDNTRISEQINLEIQRVKLKFQEKLQELAPIPDLLKATQMRLKDAQQSQAIAEHNAEQLARELNCAREKVHQLLHNSLKQPVDKVPERNNDEKAMATLQQRIAQITENNQSLKSEIERLKGNVIRMEEAVLANEKRLQEKMHECAQLGGELDRSRDEAARAVQRANERTETIRKCMQTTVAELERQLAASRAQVKTSEKEREELQCRMQCQIKRLNENFEQASLRILGLQAQVQTLRRTASSTGDGDSEIQECACKSFFDNP